MACSTVLEGDGIDYFTIFVIAEISGHIDTYNVNRSHSICCGSFFVHISAERINMGKNGKNKKKYLYYDKIHKKYIDMPDDLRSVVESMDRKTRYQTSRQYYRNNTYIIGQLNYWDDNYYAYSDKGYDDILYQQCAEKLWNDVAALVTEDEFTMLVETYVLREKFSNLSILHAHTYGAAAAIKTRVLKKLHRYFEEKYGPHAIDVYKHYFA